MPGNIRSFKKDEIGQKGRREGGNRSAKSLANDESKQGFNNKRRKSERKRCQEKMPGKKI